MNGNEAPEKFGLLSRVNIPCRNRLRQLISSASMPPRPPSLISGSKVTFSLGGGAWVQFRRDSDWRWWWLPAHLSGQIFECRVYMHRDSTLGYNSHACPGQAR